jgi:hypothetical protein
MRLVPKKSDGQMEQALGRSRGGFSTKIHVRVVGLGNPPRLRLVAGQRHDILQAVALLEGFDFDRVIATADMWPKISLIGLLKAE